jgi:hypothetical protein
MGPPRAAAARSGRAQSSRIRQWIVMTALRAKSLLRGSEAAESLVREVLEFFGESDVAEISLTKGHALLRANWTRLCGQYEPGEKDLMANVTILAELLGLDEAEHDLLALFAAVPTHPALQQTLERIEGAHRIRPPGRSRSCSAMAWTGYGKLLLLVQRWRGTKF